MLSWENVRILIKSVDDATLRGNISIEKYLNIKDIKQSENIKGNWRRAWGWSGIKQCQVQSNRGRSKEQESLLLHRLSSDDHRRTMRCVSDNDTERGKCDSRTCQEVSVPYAKLSLNSFGWTTTLWSSSGDHLSQGLFPADRDDF